MKDILGSVWQFMVTPGKMFRFKIRSRKYNSTLVVSNILDTSITLSYDLSYKFIIYLCDLYVNIG